jgi:DNA ligase-associated metallophosphoesterase
MSQSVKPNGCQSIDFHGEELLLHPEAAIWWVATRCLILSDVHLGKSATFRAHGFPVPEGENCEDLGRILNLVTKFDVETLLIVGDFLHSRTILSPELTSQIKRWLSEMPCSVLLIRGNHDPSDGKLAEFPEIEIATDHQVGPLCFVHDQGHSDPEHPTIAGHLHPKCRIGTKKGPTMQVPCFVRSNHLLVLPAFGTFTSGHSIGPRMPGEMVFPIVGGKVFASIG